MKNSLYSILIFTLIIYMRPKKFLGSFKLLHIFENFQNSDNDFCEKLSNIALVNLLT
jgi:hypothetical protein